MLNRTIRQFYRTYEPYLKMSPSYLFEKCIKDDAIASLRECVNVVLYILARVDRPKNPLSKIKRVRPWVSSCCFFLDFQAPCDHN